MTGNPDNAIGALNRRFLLDYPREAAVRIEKMDPQDAAAALTKQPAQVLAPLWRYLAPSSGVDILLALRDAAIRGVLTELLPSEAVRLLGTMDVDARKRCLDLLDTEVAAELHHLMTYPENSAGRLMDTRIVMFRDSITVREALDMLRHSRTNTTRSLFLVDDENKLSGKIAIQNLAVAEPSARLGPLAQPAVGALHPMAPQNEVTDILEQLKLADLPIVDFDGVLLGVVYHAALMHAIQEDAVADMQTMVGASKDERALSKATFAVRKRLPWLQINLLTAFLAAAVVGIFEDTIAKVTALAILLPVVAGQSGNSGAQALAVTMRGLALREITIRHWLAVTVKEVYTGLMNGVGIAITCGIGVYLWSGSFGLVAVIMLSMVLAMVTAGFAGAIVPIALTRLGQDPAQSSSIVLTTVTDVAGFFSFLGIATLMIGAL